ncbi:MAG: hypothetical protein U0559_08475 [Anaerolineae bacterium]
MNEFEQFAKAFRCSVPMAESIVARIRQRLGRDVPMGEILGAIKKIAPTRLTTDEIVKRLQKASTARVSRTVRRDDEEDFEAALEEETAQDQAASDEAAEDDDDDDAVPTVSRTRKPTAPRKVGGTQGQILEILERNWAKAKDSGLKPPELTVDRFVRTAQANVGEPKPTVARILTAVQKLSKQDVLITPNLVADEIIETDELR